jgi:hypothetical protein
MAEVSEAGRNPEAIIFNGEPSKLYYFAYGSDMNKEQIHARCADPKAVAMAKLPNFQLAFYGHSPVWDGALETVISASGQDVWGVMYELSLSDRDRLDVWHDARMDGAGASFHCPARVTDQEGKDYTVLFYKMDFQGVPQIPSREYLDFIIQGAIDNDLPSSYIEKLRGIESRNADFDVPMQKKSTRESLVEINCSQWTDGGLTIPDFLTKS